MSVVDRAKESGTPPREPLNRRVDLALVKIREVLGDRFVLASDKETQLHSRVTLPSGKLSSAIVYPGSVQDVQHVVRVCAEFKLPLWTFSKGCNWGYGSKTAAHEGAIVQILERMNRIVEVNPELAYAVIEPGVTQRQLNDHLKQHGYKLWADCTDSTPEGSVLGNALERGLGYTRYGDHFGQLCGMNVVLPNGDLFQTGGAPANSPTFHTFKWGTGPYLEGLFSQSNLGIVTQAGMWLMPEPECFNSLVFEVQRDEDLGLVIDAIRRLALSGAIQSNVHMVNDFLFLSLLTQYPYDMLDGKSCLSDEARAQLRQKYRLAPWTMVGGLYGTAQQVKAHRAAIRRELAPFGKLTFADRRKMAQAEWLLKCLKKTERVPLVSSTVKWLKERLISRAPAEVIEVLPHIDRILRGIPGERIVSCAYFKSRRGRPKTDINPARDGCGLIWFAPVVPMSSADVNRVLGLCQPLFRKYGLDFSMSFILVNPRSVVMLMEILYDRRDEEETSRAGTLYEDLADVTVHAGYQQYRTSVAYMDRILDRSPEYRRVGEAIKSALDPEGILAPGRYGLGWKQIS